MKLAEYVAQYLASKGIRHVFGVSGGACLHLIHGITDATKIQFIPTTHECNAGFAADAYARVTGLGCALATSGPGATNLITAIATSYYDSVPVVYITGNVATNRFAPPGVRQYGFQETPIVKMVRPVTKYANTLQEPSAIAWMLDDAVRRATSGRPGPVLLDIPDDLQRAEVDPSSLQRYEPAQPIHRPVDVEPLIRAIREAKRPIFIWGAGMRKDVDAARRVAETTRIPVACTWGAIDLLPHNHYLMAGGFGTHGTRAANFAVQNADLIISLGSRLDTKATGQIPHFARQAKIAMVDLDAAEIAKFDRFGLHIDFPINAPVAKVLEGLQAVEKQSLGTWQSCIGLWQRRYPGPQTGPYELIRNLDIPEDSIICSDTGFALGWMMQAFPFRGQRFIHAFNMTPMGYGLPASIGAALATRKEIVLITGDGSFMMSLPELATVARWNLPIRVILLNNNAHGMCMQTERQWFGGRHAATNIDSGLGFPDFNAVAKAFNVQMEVHAIDPLAHMEPQAKFGQPLEDADPQLPWDEFKEQMIIPPLERP